jgi:uncharacterized membrane protein YkvA (DUF1232 family)
MRGQSSRPRFGAWDRLELAWRLYRDPRVAPHLRWLAPLVLIVYVLSPIDLIPDLVLGLGQLDDLGLLGLAIYVLSRVLPGKASDDVLREHLAAMGYRDQRATASTVSGEPIVDVPYRVKQQPAAPTSRGSASR